LRQILGLRKVLVDVVKLPSFAPDEEAHVVIEHQMSNALFDSTDIRYPSDISSFEPLRFSFVGLRRYGLGFAMRLGIDATVSRSRLRLAPGPPAE